jgi:hypothetical protein
MIGLQRVLSQVDIAVSSFEYKVFLCYFSSNSLYSRANPNLPEGTSNQTNIFAPIDQNINHRQRDQDVSKAATNRGYVSSQDKPSCKEFRPDYRIASDTALLRRSQEITIEARWDLMSKRRKLVVQ